MFPGDDAGTKVLGYEVETFTAITEQTYPETILYYGVSSGYEGTIRDRPECHLLKDFCRITLR
jgi:hypothetical protein